MNEYFENLNNLNNNNFTKFYFKDVKTGKYLQFDNSILYFDNKTNNKGYEFIIQNPNVESMFLINKNNKFLMISGDAQGYYLKDSPNIFTVDYNMSLFKFSNNSEKMTIVPINYSNRNQNILYQNSTQSQMPYYLNVNSNGQILWSQDSSTASNIIMVFE